MTLITATEVEILKLRFDAASPGSGEDIEKILGAMLAIGVPQDLALNLCEGMLTYLKAGLHKDLMEPVIGKMLEAEGVQYGR